MCKVMDLAAKVGAPVIGINDSGGARIQEGVVSLGAYGDVFVRNVQCSGVIPQISRDHGPVRGRRRLLAGDDRLHLHGQGDLAHVHHRPRGDQDGHRRGGRVRGARRGDDPQHEVRRRPLRRRRRGAVPGGRPLPDVVPAPEQPRAAAAGRALRRPRARWTRRSTRSSPPTRRSPTTCATWSRWSSTTASSSRSSSTSPRTSSSASRASTAIRSGSSATSPSTWPGVLDIESSEKAARFVRFCDAFNIPLITFTDVPGFLPGTSQEWGGIIRHGAKLLYAFTEATVPKLTVVTRKAYGGAYDVMNSKHMLADFNFAWPTAEVAVMGPEGAVNIIFRRDIAQSPTPDERRAEADRRLQGAVRQPLLGRRAGLHRRRDRAARDAAEADPRPAHAADQAGRAAEAKARQHPALATDGRPRRRGDATAAVVFTSRFGTSPSPGSRRCSRPRRSPGRGTCACRAPACTCAASRTASTSCGRACTRSSTPARWPRT